MGVLRSPSSPSFVTDRDCATSFDYASHLPEWPSSPCLPTINEEGWFDRTAAPSGRSASLSTLVMPPSLPRPPPHRTLRRREGGRLDDISLGGHRSSASDSGPLSTVVISIPDYEPLIRP